MRVIPKSLSVASPSSCRVETSGSRVDATAATKRSHELEMSRSIFVALPQPTAREYGEVELSRPLDFSILTPGFFSKEFERYLISESRLALYLS